MILLLFSGQSFLELWAKQTVLGQVFKSQYDVVGSRWQVVEY